MKIDLASAIAATVVDGRGPTPEGVVQAATPESSVLHRYFTWNNEIAGHRYRLIEARELIGRVSISLHTEGGEEVIVPAFVRDPEAAHREQGYIETARVLPRGEDARGILRQELERILSGIHRARPLAQALGLGDEFEDLLASATRFAEAVRPREEEPV